MPNRGAHPSFYQKCWLHSYGHLQLLATTLLQTPDFLHSAWILLRQSHPHIDNLWHPADCLHGASQEKWCG